MAELARISRDHLNHLYRKHMVDGFLQARRQEIEQNVREMGADSYDILLPETHVLPLVVQPRERIVGIVYGRYKQENGTPVGRGALVATNWRVLLVDKKPLYMKCDVIEYREVSGITSVRAGLAGTVILHARMGDIRLRTFNRRCAANFVSAIEAMLYTLSHQEEIYDYTAAKRAL